jgi:chromosomal replication initiator protein
MKPVPPDSATVSAEVSSRFLYLLPEEATMLAPHAEKVILDPAVIPVDALCAAEAWERIRVRLKAELGDDVYSSWFTRMELDRIEGATAHLSVPTKFLKSWIQSHYVDRIARIFNAELDSVQHISLSLRTAGVKLASVSSPEAVARMPAFVPAVSEIAAVSATATPVPLAAQRDNNAAGGALVGSPIDRRLSFESFFVGRSNALAHAAALQVGQARTCDTVRFNPLYIHAAVGLGKTHLLHAIAGAAEDAGHRVLYLTAERFMFGFVSALRAQTALTFKETLRGIDVLLIDDVQFLQGKTVSQEFGHTLNALIDAGRQVVIAADRPPAELESLDERLRSRLAGGLSVEMGNLDEELRLQILKSRVATAREHNPGFSVPPAVLTYVAQAITANGRDLEGAINRLLAHNTLTSTAVTMDMAENALRDLVRTREPKRVKIEDIQRIVARHYNVSRADVLSARRTHTVVRPRQIAMYLAKVMTLRSLPEIGRRFGGRDHTTVLHAVRKIEGLLKTDTALQHDVELLNRMLAE